MQIEEVEFFRASPQVSQPIADSTHKGSLRELYRNRRNASGNFAYWGEASMKNCWTLPSCVTYSERSSEPNS